MRFTIILPVNIRYLSCYTPRGACPDLAPLTRLTQLVALHLAYTFELTQPLPQLPALLSLHVMTEDLQTVSSVAATLQELELYAADTDLRPPNTLAHFSRLHTLSLVPYEISNFSPKMLPPSLDSITVSSDLCGPMLDADDLVFPAGGHVVKTDLGDGEYVISWTRHSQSRLAMQSRRKLNGMLATWTSDW